MSRRKHSLRGNHVAAKTRRGTSGPLIQPDCPSRRQRLSRAPERFPHAQRVIMAILGMETYDIVDNRVETPPAPVNSRHWLATALTTWRPKRSSNPSVPSISALDYKAYPLKSSSSIRLLRLDASNDLESPLTGSFASTDLKARWCKTYSALSYCWGTSVQKEVIVIGNRPLQITEQLRNALRRIRARGCRVLWVDQICINQHDNAEKSQQVRLMEDVYSHATRTYGYFGETTEAEELAAACLLHLTRNGVSSMKEMRDTPLREREQAIKPLISAFLDLARQGIPGIEPAIAAETNVGELTLNVCRISQRPFLSRIWILQELIIAGPERLELLLGPQILGWDCVQALVHLLAYSGLGFSSTQVGTRLYWRLSMLNKLVLPRKDSEARKHTLLLLVSRFSSYFDCTDPRDRFYSLHGLALFRSELPIIDYTKSVREVYIDHACYFFSKNDNDTIVSDILARGFVYTDEGNVPTWCPGRPQVEHMGAGGLLYETEEDQACGPYASVIAKPDRQRGVLEASGVIFDTIEAAPPLDSDKKLDIDESIAGSWVVENCEYLAAYFWPRCGGVDVLAYELALNAMRSILGSFLERIMQRTANENGYDLEVHRSALDKFNLPEVELSPIGSDETMWKTQVTRILRDPFPNGNPEITTHLESLRFFVTKRGLFGFSFRETAPGDVVVLLAGLKMPIIFRPKGDMYQFLWKAQVNGLMQGEAFTRFGAELRPIEIC